MLRLFALSVLSTSFSIFLPLSNAVGSPNWDELLAEGDIAQMSSPESQLELGAAHNTIHQPSAVIAAKERGSPKQRPFTKKRTFSHNQQNEAKRRRGSAWKDVSPLFQKQAERSRTQQRKERVKPNSKPMTFKSRKEYYHEKVRFLKEPGNELLLQEYKERISKENKTYLAKLKKEVEDGTATKERRKLFEKRKKNSKQRRTSSTQGR